MYVINRYSLVHMYICFPHFTLLVILFMQNWYVGYDYLSIDKGCWKKKPRIDWQGCTTCFFSVSSKKHELYKLYQYLSLILKHVIVTDDKFCIFKGLLWWVFVERFYWDWNIHIQERIYSSAIKRLWNYHKLKILLGYFIFYSYTNNHYMQVFVFYNYF